MSPGGAQAGDEPGEHRTAPPAGAWRTRTQAPPERRAAEVREVTRLGAYDLITAHDSVGPPDPRPGQFYMLASGERWGGGASERPYLPRAFSHARTRPHPGGGAELQFLLEDVGPGTHRLGEMTAGDALMLVGPLGCGFSAPAQGTGPLLVGGGIGVAPLLCLYDELTDGAVLARPSPGLRSPSAPVVLGFRSGAHAEAASLFGGEDVQLATDDGSAGHHGFVTDLLAERLDRDEGVTVYACGPPQMLEAVRALCAERGVPAQLALEAGMACGYGACFGCVVPTRTDGYLRVCVDGPVIGADRLERVWHP